MTSKELEAHTNKVQVQLQDYLLRKAKAEAEAAEAIAERERLTTNAVRRELANKALHLCSV